MRDTGCDNDCWENSTMTFGEVRMFWLDTTGNPSDYSGLTLTVGMNGYLGIPGTLYLTTNADDGASTHMPLAMHIESLQFQYNGDLDADGTLDGFTNWDNANWTILSTDTDEVRLAKQEIINKIHQVRIWVLGKTDNPYVSISGTSTASHQIYRRPTIANVAGDDEDDNHRRFLLETTATIRNLTLNLYHSGIR